MDLLKVRGHTRKRAKAFWAFNGMPERAGFFY